MSSLISSINKESVSKITSGLILSPKAATAVSWVLLLLIIYSASMLTWTIWRYLQPRQEITVEAVASNKKRTTSRININQLTRYNLFGDTESTEITVDSSEIDAPVTRLKLKLRGVYAASEDELAGAMIEANNKQEVYRIGSKLPGATGLKLHKIMSDRVIMSRGGKFETLLIEDFSGASSLKSSSTSRNTSRSKTSSKATPTFNNSNVIDRRKDKKLSSDMQKLRSKLTDPQSLSELVSISPAMSGADFQGFRLAPGKNRALFGRLGLRRNDVVTAVNGISLGDPASSFSLMEQFSSAEEINMTIKRGDREMNILFKADSQ